ncbi:MAG: pseudaminic acid synthase [Cyclobacteriaceae bacterium]
MKKQTLRKLDLAGQNRPFIIAEMSGNHNQSLERALKLVDAAAKSGVDAIKLQTYTADTITFKGAFQIKDKNSLWDGQDLYDLYKTAYTPWEWHKKIFNHAKKKGMVAFSSPFDETAVDFLERLDVPLYKIASFENTDHLLLKKVAKTRKPIIMSTGASSVADIQESMEVLRSAGCKQIVLLKCTSTYPAEPIDTNILTIPHMRQLFDCPIGLSDHTRGIGVAVASVALGARVIEKHFTLRRADGGVDSAFSLEPEELENLVVESERAWQSLGNVSYSLSKKESNSVFFKRSLFVVKDISKGEKFTTENVKSIRPSTGMHTRYYKEVIGKRASTDINAGSPLNFNNIDEDID